LDSRCRPKAAIAQLREVDVEEQIAFTLKQGGLGISVDEVFVVQIRLHT